MNNITTLFKCTWQCITCTCA